MVSRLWACVCVDAFRPNHPLTSVLSGVLFLVIKKRVPGFTDTKAKYPVRYTHLSSLNYGTLCKLLSKHLRT